MSNDIHRGAVVDGGAVEIRVAKDMTHLDWVSFGSAASAIMSGVVLMVSGNVLLATGLLIAGLLMAGVLVKSRLGSKRLIPRERIVAIEADDPLHPRRARLLYRAGSTDEQVVVEFDDTAELAEARRLAS